MADMKEYLVTACDEENFIVLSKNAKDAIAQVWESYYEWKNAQMQEENQRLGFKANYIYKKSDLSASSLGSLHNQQGKIIHLW